MTAGIGAALREVLVRASYDETSVRELVRIDELDFGRGLAALRLRPEADGTLGRLVRLFLSGDELAEAIAAEALEPLAPAELVAAGLVERTRAGLRALVRLDPVEQIVVASDPRPPQKRPAPDHVVPPGPASRVLAAVTIRAQAGSALDLCCGSGVQALLAAAHAGRVVGTDLNPRALKLAGLSAALSGVQNVEWRPGDLFEAVEAGERFDLVVSNPPFVISPEQELVFRDSRGHADELSQAVVSGIAERLTDGGFGHVLCSWVQANGDHWSSTPSSWVNGHGCDAVIVRIDSEGPVSHAVRWTSQVASTPEEAIDRAAAWVDYYRELGIERIGTGIVVLRRRRGENWVEAEELVSARRGTGEQLERIFAGHDALAALPGDDALIDLPLAFAPEVRLVERRVGGGELDRARLTSRLGMQLPAGIDPPRAAAALCALDGRRTLAQAGAQAGVAAGDLAAALPSIRDLVRRGYLVPGTTA